MTERQKVIDDIVRSSVSILHDFSCPYCDASKERAKKYHNQHKDYRNAEKKERHKAQREKVKINQKCRKAYGGA